MSWCILYFMQLTLNRLVVEMCDTNRTALPYFFIFSTFLDKETLQCFPVSMWDHQTEQGPDVPGPRLLGDWPTFGHTWKVSTVWGQLTNLVNQTKQQIWHITSNPSFPSSSFCSFLGRRLWSSCYLIFSTRRRMNLQLSVLSRSFSRCLRPGDQRMSLHILIWSNSNLK